MSLLEGLRVVEMGLWIAGPAAGGMLADWGAEVIKIEMLSGDPMRNLYGAMSGSKESRCPPFDNYNRGKQSIAIDVNLPEGAALARRLALTADVFVTNMRPQFLNRVGLGHEILLAADPKLVYGLLTGYGLEGPDKDLPGYDLAAFSARAGVVHRATPPGTAPPNMPGAMGDNVTAITLVAGILGALWYRERTGRGQLVSTSLLRTGIFCISMDISTRLGLGRIADVPSRLKPPNPLMNSYRTGEDKWLWLICAESDRHWKPLTDALEAKHLREDARFGSPRDRRRNAAALVEILDGIFARRSRDEWAAVFEEHEVWWAPVNSPDDLITDAQVQAVKAFVPLPSIAGDGKTTLSVATPVDFGAEPVELPTAAPPLGSDTLDVLAKLGIDMQEVSRLKAAKIIW